MLKIACGYRFATSVCGIECCSESVEISKALLCETVLMMAVAMCLLFFSHVMFTDLKNRYTENFFVLDMQQRQAKDTEQI